MEDKEEMLKISAKDLKRMVKNQSKLLNIALKLQRDYNHLESSFIEQSFCLSALISILGDNKIVAVKDVLQRSRDMADKIIKERDDMLKRGPVIHKN